MMKRLLLLALLLSALGPGVSQAAQAFVQGKVCSKNPAGAASSWTCQFTSSVTAGNIIVAYGVSTDGTVTAHTFSDDHGGTYTQNVRTLFGAPVQASAATAVGVGVAAATGTTTVTVTFTNSVQPTFYALGISEWSGVNTTTPVDVYAINGQATPTTTTDAVTSGAVITTIDNEYIVGCAAHVQSVGTLTFGTGMTSIAVDNGASRVNIGCEYFLQTTAGSKAMTYTTSNSAADTVMFAVALKNPAAAAGTGSSAIGFLEVDE